MKSTYLRYVSRCLSLHYLSTAELDIVAPSCVLSMSDVKPETRCGILAKKYTVPVGYFLYVRYSLQARFLGNFWYVWYFWLGLRSKMTVVYYNRSLPILSDRSLPITV